MNRPKTADQSLMREMNTSIIMDCIRLSAPVSRAELSARTGLTRSTVSIIVDDLIDRGFVQEISIRQDPKIGRPGTLLQFNPEGGCAVGVEIGVDFISVLLTNFVGKALWRFKHDNSDQEDQIAALERCESIINDALEYGRQLGLRPLGIGVAIPGLVDTTQGKLVFAPNLHWVDIPLRLIWMRRFSLPVFVENDANCACLGEYFYGAAHNVSDFIFLNTGFGLGGGIMMDGKLFRGPSGFGGEVGHMTIYNSDIPCACGRKGCWELYTRHSSLLKAVCARLQQGEKSLLSDLAGADPSGITVENVAEAARLGDVLALDVLENMGRHFGVGIANLVNLFNPELVVLGGFLTPVTPWLIPVITSILEVNVLPPLRGITRVEASTQGEDSCLLGAVALVLDDVLHVPLNVL